MTTEDFERLLCANWDIEQSQNALGFLLAECDYDKCTKRERRRYKCFEDKAVISFCNAYCGKPGEVVNRNTRLKLNASERKLFKKIEKIRNKVVAHTDYDYTHFRLDSIEIAEDAYFPMPIFDEGLNFTWGEALEFQNLNSKIMRLVVRLIMKEVQDNPSRRSHYKKPIDFKDE